MLEAIVACGAGLDVHKRMVVATIQKQRTPDSEEVEETREFKTFESSLDELVKWLKSHSPEVITMESTGVYWKRLYEKLEAADLNTLVVNARHAKQLPGRKTDVKDSQWLATLGRYGLLKGSFIPPKDLRELRLLATYRIKLVGQLRGEKNRLHKILDDAGIRLGNVVSDIDGLSASRIINGLIEGNNTEELLNCLLGSLKGKREDVREALACSVGERHRFLLKQIHRHMLYLKQEIAAVDETLFQGMQPYETQWNLLKTIPGIDSVNATIILAVIGPDVSRFGSSEQLCSWAGLCPGNNESAGKRKTARTGKGHRLLRQALCEAAHAASRTHCQFKSKYQSLVIRRGRKRAIIALSHKLLRVVFSVLSQQQPYHDPEVNYTEESVKKNAPRWMKMLKQYGYFEKIV